MLPLALLVLQACLDQPQRIPLTGPATVQTVLDLGGTVELWTDLQASWDERMNITYDVRFARSGRVLARARCDALKARWRRGRHVVKDGHYDMDYVGRMPCTVKLPPGRAPTEVTVTLEVKGNIRSLTLGHADLILDDG